MATKSKTSKLPTDKAKARVEIAKDVLSMLKSKRIKADTSIWLEFDKPIFREDQYEENIDAKTVLSGVKKCEACAVGSLVLATVCRFDKIGIADLTDSDPTSIDYDDETVGYLQKFFPARQLEAIEISYETNQGCYQTDAYNGDSYLLAALAFGLKYDKDSDRMIAIMENIVKNKGNFTPLGVKP
jgi:hypothetical protein